MQIKQIQILILFILVHIILNETIKNYEGITFKDQIVLYYDYNPSYTNTDDDIGAYFFFRFSFIRVHLHIKDEDGNDDLLVSDNFYVCQYFKIKNKKPQTYTFYLSCNNCGTVSMFFIDNSNEINITFNQFYEKYVDTVLINDTAPLPLIFNLEDEIEGNSQIIEMDTNYNASTIYNGKYKIEYCEINEKGCDFTYNEPNLIIEKDKKYKIRFNCFKGDNDTYYFIRYNISRIIKEVGYGYYNYQVKEKPEDLYYIFNYSNYKEFYIYLSDYNRLNYSMRMAFVTENEKKEFLNNKNIFDNLNYEKALDRQLNKIESKKDYLIVNFKYGPGIFNGYIYFFHLLFRLENNPKISLEKGEYGIVYLKLDSFDKIDNIIVSSNYNIKKITNYNFYNQKLSNLMIIKSEDNDREFYEHKFIYVDSTKEKTIINYFIYKKDIFLTNEINFNYFNDINLANSLNKYGSDYYFKRTSTNYLAFDYMTSLFFGLNETYYLFCRKYVGGIDFYKYNQSLDFYSDVSPFIKPYHFYNSIDDYEIINNKLLIVSGYQIFSFLNSHESLFDFYFQKTNDFIHIEINSKMFKYNNLVKLFNVDKTYYLDFNVDHLIKLDKEFLDAEVIFTDKEGVEYKLNKDHKILSDLKGEKITVTATNLALVYFYKRMSSTAKISMVEFDKTQIGKNMKFDITSKSLSKIYIAKDFGFNGYYPMISKESWIKINPRGNIATIYAENLYDKLDYDLYEDEVEKEKYYIYIIMSEDCNLPQYCNYTVGDPVYFDNLLTPKNKYNFEVIHQNSPGSIILNLPRLDPVYDRYIFYQFFPCQKTEIDFTIENTNGYFFPQDYYPYKKTIINDDQFYFDLDTDEILVHSFKSNNKFLFKFSFNHYYHCSKIDDFSIISIIEISNNILQIKFKPDFSCLSQYFIMIAKKDNNNSIELFSDRCHLSRILSQNLTNSIVFKLFSQEEYIDMLAANIDISKLNVKENNELIANIINYNSLNIYKALEFKLQKPDFIKFDIEEEVSFNFEDRNYFKFEYTHESDSPQEIYFYFSSMYNFYVLFTDELKTSIFEFNTNEKELMKIILTKSGTYYIEFYSPNSTYSIYDNRFISFFPGKIIIDTIDLSEKMYYRKSKVEKIKAIVEPNISNIYKVKNLKNDTLIYFSYTIENEEEEEDVFGSNEFSNPFEICNDNTNNCTNNITFFKFLKGNEYTIYIHFAKNLWREESNFYYYPTYMFFPIFEGKYELVEEGFYSTSDPKVYIVNIKDKFFIHLYHYNAMKVYMSFSNEINDLSGINNLTFKGISNLTLITGANGFNYAILIIIPKMNNNSAKIIIANELIKKHDQEESVYNNYEGKNAIIIFTKTNENMENEYDWLSSQKILKKLSQYEDSEEEEEDEYEEDKKTFSYHNLTTFSSEENNMRYVKSNDSSENYDFMVQNSCPIPIYVDKSDKDVKIKIKTYSPRYSYFDAINNNLINNYITSISERSNELLNLSQLFPLNIRINTDYYGFYDFINFYLYEVENKLNIYIKKIYGASDIYECDADSIDKKDLSILTKPISDCKDKKSILNKIYNLEGTKLITGYLGPNSYYDIYLDLNDNSNNIKIPSIMKNIYNSVAKYLKIGKEYNLDFEANHLVKLDPEFNAEISIYDDTGANYKINSKNPTSIIKGNNLKIRSNNDAMVYFYGKNNRHGFKQIKIDIEKRKNVEIKIEKNTAYILDFGFQGYSPIDLSGIKNNGRMKKNGMLFIENIYDKLKTKLVEEEFLYLYYNGSNIEIDYKENINNPNNEYTFNVIPKNSENKTLIINNIKMNQIKYQINFCKSAHNLKMFYQSGMSLKETLFEFSDNITTLEQNINKMPFKLRFESKEDFIFSYSFIDSQDKLFNQNSQWIEERKVLTNLNIEEIIMQKSTKENSYIISIKFYPNYKASSTRYILVIAPKTIYNTKKSLSNPCYITKLVTEKVEGIKIIDLIDTGENDTINLDVDISDLSIINNKLVVAIISQELRFEKKVNYYNPFEFSLIQDTTNEIDIDIDEENEFYFNDTIYYELPYIKNSNMNEMLLLNYKLDEEISMKIHFYYPNNTEQSINVDNKEGSVYFLCEESGFYRIFFEKIENNLLLSTDNSGKGTFKILSTEYPFNIDITKDNIGFNEFSMTREEAPSLKLIIEPLEKDYIKKINIANIYFNQINKIVSISENNQEYKTLNFSYYTFEKGKNYNIIINFNKKEKNKFTLEKMNILDFSQDNINNFALGHITYNDKNDKFIIINWTNYTKNINILITAINNDAKLLESEITEYQSINLVKEFQNLNFTRLENSKTYKIGKPLKTNYSVLLIELDKEGTEMKFETKENKNKDDNKGSSALFIVLISIFGLILIVVIIFFILRYLRRKSNNIDLTKQSNTFENVKLLKDI